MKMKENATTKFLPAGRNPPGTIAAERQALEGLPHLRALLDAMPQFVLVLDGARQIVLANRAVIEALELPEETILGLRPGEALGCARARAAGNCGVTEHCTVCGAGRAMLSALRGRDDERDCRMIVAPPGTDRDLSVRVSRLRHAGFAFTVFVATDRSAENRRRTLERLFFHDALNTAGAVNGLSELIPEADDADFGNLCGLLQDASGQLVGQITAQRDLAAAEAGEYVVRPSPCPLREFVETTTRLAAAHPAVAGRRIEVDPGPDGARVVTDRTLLMRVFENMLKNAAEAEPVGATVRAGWEAGPDGGAVLWVRNPSVMPRLVQLQVFQRSFSTKGEGRGLGTYSVRLLTERYLGGTATFSSEEGRGTEFRVSLPPGIGAARQPGSAESSNL